MSSELHFGVYALTHISPDEEVTLPFDFRYDKWCVRVDVVLVGVVLVWTFVWC